MDSTLRLTDLKLTKGAVLWLWAQNELTIVSGHFEPRKSLGFSFLGLYFLSSFKNTVSFLWVQKSKSVLFSGVRIFGMFGANPLPPLVSH